MWACVIRKDSERNLAELLPSSRALSTNHPPLISSADPELGTAGEIGSPLLVVDVGSGVPSVRVAGMRYVTRVGELFQQSWKINPQAPRGLIGGGVWDVDGKFMGVAIGEKVPSPFEQDTQPDKSVYALPAEQALDFAESN